MDFFNHKEQEVLSFSKKVDALKQFNSLSEIKRSFFAH